MKEPFNFTHGVFCWLCLLCSDGDGAKGDEYCGIHILCVVEKTLMTSRTHLVRRTKRWGCVCVFCTLGFVIIDLFDVGVGLTLVFRGALVVDIFDGICNIGEHREVKFGEVWSAVSSQSSHQQLNILLVSCSGTILRGSRFVMYALVVRGLVVITETLPTILVSF